MENVEKMLNNHGLPDGNDGFSICVMGEITIYLVVRPYKSNIFVGNNII